MVEVNEHPALFDFGTEVMKMSHAYRFRVLADAVQLIFRQGDDAWEWDAEASRRDRVTPR